MTGIRLGSAQGQRLSARARRSAQASVRSAMTVRLVVDSPSGLVLTESMPATETPTAYQRLNALGREYDQTIASAMENAYDYGLREEAEDDGEAFWQMVWDEVTYDQ